MSVAISFFHSDYGYEKDQSGNCKQDKAIPPLKVCKDGEEMIEKFSKGYVYIVSLSGEEI